MTQRDITIRAPAGAGSTDITIQPPAPLDPAPPTAIYLSRPGATDQIFVYPTTSSDGTPGVLYGGRTNVSGGVVTAVVENAVQLQGQAITVSQGTIFVPDLSSYFIYDTFTDPDNTDIATHVPEVGTWVYDTGPPTSSLLIINNALQVTAAADAVYKNAGPTSGAHSYLIEADLVYLGGGNEQDPGTGIVTYSVGVHVSPLGGVETGYFFGFDTLANVWRLWMQWTSSPLSQTSLATSSSNLPSTPGDARTIRLEVANDTQALLQCFVDDVLVISYTDTFDGVPWASNQITALRGIGEGFGATNPTIAYSAIRARDNVRKLTGQRISISQGAAVGAASGGTTVTGSPGGQSMTVTQGTITPAITTALTGQSITIAQGSVTASTHDVSVSLSGMSLTVAQGGLTPKLTIGASAGGAPLNPVTTMGAGLVRTFPTAGYKRPGNAPMSVGGRLRGVFEDYTAPSATQFTFDPGVQGTRCIVKSDGSVSFTPGGATGLGRYNPWYRGLAPNMERMLPNGEMFNYTVYSGGSYSFDRDNQMHWVHTRALAWDGEDFSAQFAGGKHFRPRFGDVLHVYQSDYDVEQTPGSQVDHSLPYALRRPNIYFDKNCEHLLGLYAHARNNVWVFFPEPVDTSPITGQGVTIQQGTITPYVTGQPNLVGGVLNVRQGVLIGHVTAGSTSPTLTGQSIAVRQGTVGRYDPANIVPTYWRGDGYSWALRRVQLTNFTGASNCFAIKEKFTVVRTGYGDTIYILYLSGTPTARYTPSYIGMIVLDAVTGFVQSHALTAITQARATTGSTARPLADVVRLSSGTSVTQFMLDGYLLHLTWTSGTYLTPTLTQKVPPSVPGGTTRFISGFESFDHKGDEVYYTLFAYAEGANPRGNPFFYVQPVWNDASGTGSSWTNGTMVQTGTEPFGFPSFAMLSNNDGYSGGGEDGPTWMQIAWDNDSSTPQSYPEGEGGSLDNPNNYVLDAPQTLNGSFYSSGANSLSFNYQHFANQAPYFGVQAQGAVGVCTVTITQGVVAQLTGQAITVAQGSMTPGIGAGGSLFDDFGGEILHGMGLSITIYQGAFIFGATGLPDGQRMTIAQGGLSPAIDAFPPGRSATVTAGVLTPEIKVALTGQSLTVTPGALQPSTSVSITLTGLAATVAQGALTGSTSYVGSLTGLAATVVPGSLTPGVAGVLPGQAMTVAQGALTPGVAGVLPGLAVTIAQGSLGKEIVASPAGRALTVVPGALGIIHSQTVNVTGVSATGAVGSVTTDVPAIREHLWARTAVQNLFVTAEPTKLYNPE